ncbi:restriction endonuclease subunit S [Empedobacter sp. GD03739]|uniref:restriction endonuclease subunit S n=1 Tax=Empedobacter sp. GD03739 TaxID=2975376 RepID=UPI00244774B6|nr:restriction endonuclease subunit S [Empedobacter sp. GD03739]MDH1604037.1 restriction endonuclease subunit S [Empedobacter sp. GD03739]
MENVKKTFLNFLNFTDLENWSSYSLLGKNLNYTQKFQFAKIGSFLKRNKTPIDVVDGQFYKRATIKINGQGIFLRDIKDGKEIGTKKQFLISKGQFLLSKIDARNGAFGVVPEELEGAIITGNFWTFDVDYSLVNPFYLTLLTGTKEFQKLSQTASVGTTNRNYLQEVDFLNFKVPLPTLQEQQEIVEAYFKKINEANQLEVDGKNIDQEIEKYLFTELGISVGNKKENKKGLNLVEFKDVLEWGTDKLLLSSGFESKQFKLKSLSKYESLIDDVFRGKSPKYADKSDKYILNQKCNRWNKIELEFAKTVVPEWYKNIDQKFFTKEGDIIINSTGEGTIGRASYVSKEFEGLIYDSHILLIRLNSSIFNPELFVELFNSDFGQSQVNQIKSAQATKQTELGVNNLLKIEIPVVQDVEKQKLIVEEIKVFRQTASENIIKIEELKHQANEEFEKEIFQ